MRIVCQKCSSAYAIDDKFVTPKGVRAQCPRCRHLQLVKKEDVAAPVEIAPPAAPASSGSSPFLFDMASKPPPAASGQPFGSAPSTQSAGPGAFDFSSPPAPQAPLPPSFPPPARPPPAPNPNASPFDFSAPSLGLGTSPGSRSPLAIPAPGPVAPQPLPPSSSPFDFSGAALRPTSSSGLRSPLDSEPGAGSPFDFAAPAAPGAAGGSPFDFGSSAPPLPPAPTTSGFGELDFGSPPPAPTRLSAPAPRPVESSPLDNSATVACRNCGKSMSDPFDQALGVCDDCRNKTAEVAAAHSPFPPADSLNRTTAPPLFPDATTPITTAADARGVRSATREGGGGPASGRGRAIGIAGVVLLVLGGLGAFLVIKRPWVRKAPPLVVKPSEGLRPTEAIVQQWKLKYPELQNVSSEQLTKDGEVALNKDTTTGYRDAEQLFEQALVVDSSNARALAGWVLSLAFGRGGKIDEQTQKAAESMLSSTEQRTGDLRVFVAHAHLSIALGQNPNDIRTRAERGLSSDDVRDRALAELAVGTTLLAKNPQQADERFKQALATDPSLKRAYFFQARLAASQGKYKDATSALERRLALDADQWEAAEELARLFVDVNELSRARKVLETARAVDPRAAKPRLALAVLRYQHLGDLTNASLELQALIDDAEVSRGEKSEAYVHLATIQRMNADPETAELTIRKALELNPESVPARLQHLLTYLDKNTVSNARLELDGLKGRLGDKYLEQTLEGLVLMGEKHFDEALTILSAVSEADPRRVDATLLAGAAAAKAKKTGKAWEMCIRRGLHSDPLSRPVESMTLMFVRPADLLFAAEGAYKALASDLENDPSPWVCEGLVQWYLEDPATADQNFSKATSIDAHNSDAFAYRSMLATRRKDLGGAVRFGARAVDGNRGNALGWYAQSLAQQAANKLDQAKISATESQRLDPKLLGPRVIIGDAEAQQKHRDEARTLLTSVLLSDPLFREAKRVLFRHQL